MKQQIKRIASRLRLPSGIDQEQSTDRNVTPPSSTSPEDTFTTPPQQTLGVDDSPADATLLTPLAPPGTSPNKPSLIKRLLEPLVGQPQKEQLPKVNPDFAQGVTGSDTTLPIFDGTSKKIEDHLIDLETDSMETEPDVRSYFWQFGCALDDDNDPPIDLEERKIFDAKMVRRGREHLKMLKSQGVGWFLSRERDVIAKNVLGSDWYRSPTTAICFELGEGELQPMEDECYFHHDEGDKYWEPIPTNMRVPMWWFEAAQEGIVPGTRGWDQTVCQLYAEQRHPGHAMYKGWTREDVIDYLVCGGWPVDRVKARQILRRDWPDVANPMDRDSPAEFIGPGYLELQGITADQFMGRTK